MRKKTNKNQSQQARMLECSSIIENAPYYFASGLGSSKLVGSSGGSCSGNSHSGNSSHSGSGGNSGGGNSSRATMPRVTTV